MACVIGNQPQINGMDVDVMLVDELDIHPNRQTHIIAMGHQHNFSQPLLVESVKKPIVYGPVKKRGKGKVKKW